MRQTPKSRHTPGPWTPERDRAKSLSLYSGSTFICEVYHEVDEPSAQEQANVRLIAAAPAMYQSGTLTVDIMERVAKELERKGLEELRSLLRSAIIEQRQALAQAEGSKP